MSALLVPEPPLQVLPTLACKVGLNEAIFLQQLHYWSLRANDAEGWVYKTLGEWVEELPWLKGGTDSAIRKLVKGLEGEGLIESKQPEGTTRRKHYRILYDALPQAAEMAASSGRNGRLTSKAETTTEKESTKKAVKTVNRKAVSEHELALTAAVVQAFNEIAGTALRTDPHLTPIVGRIREWPKLTAAQHRKIIEAVFAGDHWWKGPPGPRIIYGNAAQFEQSIELARAEKKKPERVDINAEAARIRREQGLE